LVVFMAGMPTRTTQMRLSRMTELEPCPFCGSDDLGERESVRDEYCARVICHECEGCVDGPNLAAVVAVWNRRATGGAPVENRTRPLTEQSQPWTPEHCKAYPRRASEEIEYLRGQLAARGVPGNQQEGGNG
jgi:hypothetical protein